MTHVIFVYFPTIQLGTPYKNKTNKPYFSMITNLRWAWTEYNSQHAAA